MEGRVPPLLSTWVPPEMKMQTGLCHGGVSPAQRPAHRLYNRLRGRMLD